VFIPLQIAFEIPFVGVLLLLEVVSVVVYLVAAAVNIRKAPWLAAYYILIAIPF
jgi:hypothetical protein